MVNSDLLKKCVLHGHTVEQTALDIGPDLREAVNNRRHDQENSVVRNTFVFLVSANRVACQVVGCAPRDRTSTPLSKLLLKTIAITGLDLNSWPLRMCLGGEKKEAQPCELCFLRVLKSRRKTKVFRREIKHSLSHPDDGVDSCKLQQQPNQTHKG